MSECHIFKYSIEVTDRIPCQIFMSHVQPFRIPLLIFYDHTVKYFPKKGSSINEVKLMSEPNHTIDLFSVIIQPSIHQVLLILEIFKVEIPARFFQAPSERKWVTNRDNHFKIIGLVQPVCRKQCNGILDQ